MKKLKRKNKRKMKEIRKLKGEKNAHPSQIVPLRAPPKIGAANLVIDEVTISTSLSTGTLRTTKVTIDWSLIC